MIGNNQIRAKHNLELAYDRLVSNSEATYKNYFRNVYAAYQMSKKKNIANLARRINAGYIPEKSYKIYAPKKNGLTRMFTLLSVEDQIVYQAYANKLADQLIQIESVKKRYRKSVFGNLYNGKGELFFFQNWESAYRDYTHAIIHAYRVGNEYIASFDLTACYDSINHNLIRDMLIKYHFSVPCADSLIRLLEQWSSPTSNYSLGVGIPQGPMASGIIAEAVLGEYDRFIEGLQKKYSFRYFRYVDDIKILAKDEKTVHWVLFLLDLKSKELGLFPQASKVSVHKIVDIYDEVKQISKPLFDDDVEDEMIPSEAISKLKALLKSKSNDITSIKRYIQFIVPCSQNNRLVLKLLNSYPEISTSFIYYIQRYSRKLPPTITEYIKSVCLDKTKQYLAGLYLEASTQKMSKQTTHDFGKIAKELLNKDKREKFICDPLFKEQLYLLLIVSGMFKNKTYSKKIKNENNWWIKQRLVSEVANCDIPDELINNLVNQLIVSENSDEALIASVETVVLPNIVKIPNRKFIAPIAQESLKAAGVISRSKYSSSQINKYLELITGEKWSFPWRKLLNRDHDNIEQFIFLALCHWNNNVTYFVNIWDSIDDAVLRVLMPSHRELGGFTPGNFGFLSSHAFTSHLPNFSAMIKYMHDLRLTSCLSHSVNRTTGKFNGPIPYKERKNIVAEIRKGLRELEAYWH